MKKKSSTKVITIYLFTLLDIILIYAMVAMWYFADLTYLGALISDIGGQVITFAIYASKSKAENTEGGIVYETAMHELKNSEEDDSGESEDAG